MDAQDSFKEYLDINLICLLLAKDVAVVATVTGRLWWIQGQFLHICRHIVVYVLL